MAETSWTLNPQQCDDIAKDFATNRDAAYARFLNICNGWAETQQTIKNTVSFLSSDAPLAIGVRQHLLELDAASNPSWDDLFRARIKFDLVNPNIFSVIDKTDEEGEIETPSQNEPLEHGKRLRRMASAKDGSRQSKVDAALLDALSNTAVVVRKSLSCHLNKLQFLDRSLMYLFGLGDTRTTSIQMLRVHLKQLGFAKRKFITETILRKCLEGGITLVTSNVAREVFRHCNTKRQLIDRGSVDDDSQNHPTRPPTELIPMVTPVKKSKKEKGFNHKANGNLDEIGSSEDDGSSLLSLKEHDTSSYSSSHNKQPSTTSHSTSSKHTETGALLVGTDRPSAAQPNMSLQQYMQGDVIFMREIQAMLSGKNCALSELLLSPSAVGSLRSNTSNNTAMQHTSGGRVLLVHLLARHNETRPARTPFSQVHGTEHGVPGPVAASIFGVFHKTLRAEIDASLNLSHFVKGVGGREGSYLRIASQHCTYFQVGRYFYPSDKINQTEEKIIHLVNTFLSMQTRSLQTSSGNGKKYVPFPSQVNTLQIVVEYLSRNSGYALHSDYGRLLNTPGTIPDYSSDDSSLGSRQCTSVRRLPYREEMQTITIVLTSLPDEQKMQTHQLLFYQGDVCIGKLPTSGNMMHVQLHGTQLYQHEVKPINVTNYQNHVRIVLSCRFTVPMTVQGLREVFHNSIRSNTVIDPSEYKWTHVLDKLTNCELPLLKHNVGNDSCDDLSWSPRSHSGSISERQSTASGSTSEAHPESLRVQHKERLRDVYSSVPRRERTQAGIHRVQWRMEEYPQKKWKFINRGDVVGPLALRHSVLTSTRFHGPTDTLLQALLTTPTTRRSNGTEGERILRPLQALPLETVVALGNLPHSQYSHPVCSGHERTCNLILLSKPYKTDIDLVRRIVEQYSDWQNTGPSDQHLTNLKFCGSGGAPRSTDAYACNVSRLGKADASSTTPVPQSIFDSPQNTTFTRLSERRAVVAVFIKLKEWKHFLPSHITPSGTPPSDDSALFIGYFYFASMEYKALSRDDLNTFWPRAVQHSLCLPEPKKRESFLEYSRFRQETHLTFTLNPVFSTYDQLSTIYNRPDDYLYSSIRTNANNKVRATISRPAESTDPVITSNEEQHLDSGNASFIAAYLEEYFQETNVEDGHHHPDEERERQMVDDDDNDDEIINQGCRLQSMDHLLVHLTLVSVSGALRYLRKNLVPHAATNTFRSAPLPINPPLPSIYRAHPMPFPIRSYDVMPLLLRACAINMGILSRETPNVRSLAYPDADLFFMSIMNRLTGRTGVHLAFCNLYGTKNSTPLPHRDEIVAWTRFVKVNEAERLLFSHQHIRSLPNDIRLNFVVMERCAIDFADTCEGCLHRMKTPKTRVHAVNELGQFLFNIVEAQKTHLNERGRPLTKFYFLAHQIVSDLEEIYQSPFGTVALDSVHAGPGGLQGMELCQKSGIELPIIDSTLAYINRVLSRKTTESKMMRTALGCTIDAAGTVVVALNQRPLNRSDAEHFLCKLYLGIVKTVSTRSTSATPIPSRPGFHPVCCSNNQLPWDDSNVKTIMLDIGDAYEYLIRTRSISFTPDLFLLLGEPDPLTGNNAPTSEDDSN